MSHKTREIPFNRLKIGDILVYTLPNSKVSLSGEVDFIDRKNKLVTVTPGRQLKISRSKVKIEIPEAIESMMLLHRGKPVQYRGISLE